MKKTCILAVLAALSIVLPSMVAMVQGQYMILSILNPRGTVWIINTDGEPLPTGIDTNSFVGTCYTPTAVEVYPMKVIIIGNSIQLAFKAADLPQQCSATRVTFLADSIEYPVDGPGFAMGGHK